MIQFVKRLMPSKFKRDVKEHLGVPSLHWSLQNMQRCGFTPSFVLDIGAYEGYWTQDLLEVFPDARVYMIEAQESKREKLEAVAKQFPKVDFAIQLLSSRDGSEVFFLESETASHVLKEPPAEGAAVKKTMCLDTLVESKYNTYPDMLKLDVQGHELEVLKGGVRCLRHAQACLLEVSLMDIGDGSPLLAEVLDFMGEHQFQAYDIPGFMRRPYDKALYQIDILFVKTNSSLIAAKRWN